MTHTEKVHVVFGVLAALTGGLALWHVVRPRSYAGLAWPLLAFIIGLCLFIPVESQSRSYQMVRWSDALVSAVPEHPATWLRDWFHYLPQRHVIQHKVGALLIMAIGLIEALRARGRLSGSAWRLMLPSLLLGVALSFGVHGGTEAHLSHPTEQVSHHALGVAFAVGALTLALARAGWLQGRVWEGLWAALVLVMGVTLAVSYRLTPVERSTEVHHHESTGPRLR